MGSVDWVGGKGCLCAAAGRKSVSGEGVGGEAGSGEAAQLWHPLRWPPLQGWRAFFLGKAGGLLSRDVVTALRTQKLPMRGLDGIQGLGPCQWQMLPNRGCVLGTVGSNREETLRWL